jgi:hypothetical protein
VRAGSQGEIPELQHEKAMQCRKQFCLSNSRRLFLLAARDKTAGETPALLQPSLLCGAAEQYSDNQVWDENKFWSYGFALR